MGGVIGLEVIKNSRSSFFFNIKELFGRFQILKSSAAAFSMQENVSPNVLFDIAFYSLKFVAKFSKQEK